MDNRWTCRARCVCSYLLRTADLWIAVAAARSAKPRVPSPAAANAADFTVLTSATVVVLLPGSCRMRGGGMAAGLRWHPTDVPLRDAMSRTKPHVFRCSSTIGHHGVSGTAVSAVRRLGRKHRPGVMDVVPVPAPVPLFRYMLPVRRGDKARVGLRCRGDTNRGTFRCRVLRVLLMVILVLHPVALRAAGSSPPRPESPAGVMRWV